MFADTSAVVKLYVDEIGAEPVWSVTGLTISELSRVELPAALWCKHRAGELSSESAGVLAGAFEADYYGSDGDSRFTVTRVSDPVVAMAARLVARSDLRAGDAIQLASALLARQAEPELTTFAAFDARLRTAAAVEGFALLPPTVAV